MQLGALCDIHSGYTARGKLDPLPQGGVPAIQLRDVHTDGVTLGPTLQRYDLGDLADRYFVRGGEIVFRPRGEPNTAVAVRKTLAEPAAVILPLMIMRPKGERALPEYLAWAINQPDAQRRLGAEAQGTSLRMISKAAIEKLDIAVPDIATQRRIVDIDALARRERHLLRELADLRAQLTTITLGDAARAAEHKDIAR